jgi:hypothetical protein
MCILEFQDVQFHTDDFQSSYFKSEFGNLVEFSKQSLGESVTHQKIQNY